MDRPVGQGIELDVAKDTALRAAVAELQIHDVGFRGIDQGLQAFLRHGDRDILLPVEIKNPGHFALPPDRTRVLAELVPDFRFQQYFTHGKVLFYPLSTSNRELID